MCFVAKLTSRDLLFWIISEHIQVFALYHRVGLPTKGCQLNFGLSSDVKEAYVKGSVWILIIRICL